MGASLLCCALLLGATPVVPHFDTEIMPIFTRAGCNAGSCHGASAGRGGFHLSLWGSDPSTDYDTIVHAFEGRRINLARPTDSLLLLKATGLLKHGGKRVLDEDAPSAKHLVAWVTAGAPRGGSRRLTHFNVSAQPERDDRDQGEIRLRAVARFDEGVEVDVTLWTVFTVADPGAVTLLGKEQATVRILRPGKHDLMARFLDRVEPMRITRPIGDKPVDLSQESRENSIDDEVIKTLTLLRVPISPQADDATFLRRVLIDLTGTLPTPREVDDYVKDRSTSKRQSLVDRLLTSREYADYWTLRFARMLQVHSLPNEKQGVQAYTQWLHASLRDNKPMDQWARELLTAAGDSHEVGPANFARMSTDARRQAELVSRVFLGARLQCANCHQHPLDRWTQDDYHGLAAVFAKLERGRVVKIAARGAVTNLRTGEPAVPRIPGYRNLDASQDNRAEFADWLTAKDNLVFAKAQVNRVWRAMFGRGLVEPVDDLRATNPATHPRLLERLAEELVRHRYDLRQTLRSIALSQAYGRASEPVVGNESDDRYYARGYRRPLEPEVLADAIATVTGVAHAYGNLPIGTRAITIYDPLTPAPSLDLLGRCARASGCEETATTGGLPAKLHLLNGELINAKITAKNGRLAQWLAAGKPDRDIVTECYVLGLGRKPTTKEIDGWLSRIDKSARRECLEDFLWSLLNSRDFSTNH